MVLPSTFRSDSDPAASLFHLQLGLWLHWALLDNTGWLPYLKILNLTTSQNPFFFFFGHIRWCMGGGLRVVLFCLPQSLQLFFTQQLTVILFLHIASLLFHFLNMPDFELDISSFLSQELTGLKYSRHLPHPDSPSCLSTNASQENFPLTHLPLHPTPCCISLPSFSSRYSSHSHSIHFTYLFLICLYQLTSKCHEGTDYFFCFAHCCIPQYWQE